jgi:iron complex transport system ATP-binding protein
VGFVLSEDDDLSQARVDEIRNSEINQAIVSRKRNSRFGPISSERHEPFAFPASEDNAKNLVFRHVSSVVLTLTTPQLGRGVRLGDMSEVASFRSVGFVRDQKSILKDIDWTIDSSERWVIVGPNGAGKTTVLSMLASLTYPSTGSVTVLGEKLGKTDVFELRPRVGYASSDMTNRIPYNETVLDTVLTAAYGVMGRWQEEYEDIDTRRALRVLNEWRLEHLAQTPIKLLSDGEKKRVQIARAVMTDPELLLLDEPAGSLDVGAREDVIEMLDHFASDPGSPAMVMVTHHVEEIPAGFTHLLVIAQGSVIQKGPIADTLSGDVLSEAFGRPLSVTHNNGRYQATAL